MSYNYKPFIVLELCVLLSISMNILVLKYLACHAKGNANAVLKGTQHVYIHGLHSGKLVLSLILTNIWFPKQGLILMISLHYGVMKMPADFGFAKRYLLSSITCGDLFAWKSLCSHSLPAKHIGASHFVPSPVHNSCW